MSKDHPNPNREAAVKETVARTNDDCKRNGLPQDWFVDYNRDGVAFVNCKKITGYQTPDKKARKEVASTTKPVKGLQKKPKSKEKLNEKPDKPAGRKGRGSDGGVPGGRQTLGGKRPGKRRDDTRRSR